MSLGFEQAGFDIIGSVELDPIHCAAHHYNFPKTRVFCANASELEGRTVLRELGVRQGEIDVVFGGPPCQGFSMIGKRLLDDPRNGLLSHFLRLVQAVRPKYFVMENVAGLSLGHSRSVLDAFLDQAREIGYKVSTPCQVLNAAHYGVPQDRRRIFVIGYRRGFAAPEYPAARTVARLKTGKPKCPPHDSGRALPLCPSVGDAIGDLPNIDGFPELLESDAVRCALKGGTKYAKILRGDLSNPEDYSYPRRYDGGLLTSSARAEHTALSRKRFAATIPGETEPISRFFKLPLEGISNTLRAGTPSNRGAFTSPRPIHPVNPRCISVREAARLHSYPDWFRFHVTKWHGFRQIGNSVPPLLARAVAGEVIKALGERPKRPKYALDLGDEQLLRLVMTAAAALYDVSPHVIEPRERAAR